MVSNRIQLTSRGLLAGLGTRIFLHHGDRIPAEGAVLMVSNHRSFLDPLVLMATVHRPIRFACHPFMGQVPLLRETIDAVGAFPLDHRPKPFFRQAAGLLHRREMVGIFPEGAAPMLRRTPPDRVGSFHRGFAHLALRTPVRELVLLPVAIASVEETCISSGIPIKVLSWFDPAEPQFDQPGWHPALVYRQVNVLVGRPYWVKPQLQGQYRGRDAKAAVADLTSYCKTEIADLLRRGCL
ncbi:MAG: lysophospholipid acyltransferase family protein [Limnospira sp.]